MNPPSHWLHHKGFLFFFFLIAANLIALNALIVWQFTLGRQQIQQNESKATSTSLLNQEAGISCPKNCLTLIDQSFTKIAASTKEAALANSYQTKEYFIPLGTGNSDMDDWVDLAGLSITINSNNYANIKSAVFEVSTHVPNANEIVEVRLFNATNNRVVDNSYLTFPSGKTPSLMSTPIVLGYGTKIYKVQMKTQFRTTAVLDVARIHITTY